MAALITGASDLGVHPFQALGRALERRGLTGYFLLADGRAPRAGETSWPLDSGLASASVFVPLDPATQARNGAELSQVLLESGFRALRASSTGASSADESPRRFVALACDSDLPGSERLVELELWTRLAPELERRLRAGSAPCSGGLWLAPEAALFPSRPAQQPEVRPLERGLAVAFVGSDGAGKSTVTQDFIRCMSSRVEVEPVYMGSGDGPSSWLRWPMLKVIRLVRRLRPRPASLGREPSAAGRTPLRRRFRPLWALALAREKGQRLDALERGRARGRLVVCDRYPQNEIVGFNDGPLLDAWRQSRFAPLRALARWERRPYDRAHATPPDLVVKLVVGLDVARARRPEMEPAELRRRIDAVARLGFGGAEVLLVDAEQPLEAVLSAVKRGVWQRV